MSFPDPTLGAGVSQSPFETPRLRPARPSTRSLSQSISCVTKHVGATEDEPLQFASAPTYHPSYARHPHAPRELSLFPICHPVLSRQQRLLSKVLVIDCYCKAGRGPRGVGFPATDLDCGAGVGTVAAVWVQCSLCGGPS